MVTTTPLSLSLSLSIFIFLQTRIYLLNIFTINTHIPFKVITTPKGENGLPQTSKRNETEGLVSQSSQPQRELSLKDSNEAWTIRNSRRLMIGSTAPTCTYNECRGCKYKCRAEQVPVEGNDPINSPYHYRCVCHR
ncbi:EPIDERMAL PATTERNING FACTOR-like protein 9 isoform X1 [Gastrolobium bilobum]|uniref:EPIDERMAL PATTERNING FACTOR-like protein 9 isoform X1 n=1 Tax=Gastrolobium bilobum TaxID=150636 RepID=UPI002AB081B5|nr:EPIDERMAL PATTERNING FACTOR-like protein 9 isoform X1 [Gastrolobium bilobum]